MQQQPPTLLHRVAPIRLRHALRVVRDEEAKRFFSGETPTQTTGAIKPIRLVNTDSIPVIQPPSTAVIHIGSVHPPLLQLNPISAMTVLHGYRMAYLGKRIVLKDAVYLIQDIYIHPDAAGQIMARLERQPKDA